jgi:general secretion pathway protein L
MVFERLRLHLSRLVETVRDLFGRFSRWWLDELARLLPSRIAEWLVGRGPKQVVMATEPDAIRLVLLDDKRQPIASAQVNRSEYSAAKVDDFLKKHDVGKMDVAVGIRLPAERFFARRLILPLEAARALNEVMVQDLTRKTPFRIPEIYHDCVSARSADADKIVVWQWIIRREFVHEAATSLGVDRDVLAFVEAEEASRGNGPAPLIHLRQTSGSQASRLRRATVALAAITLVLALGSGGLKYWRQQSLIDRLAGEVGAARSKAQQVRSMINGLEAKQSVLLQLRSQKGGTPGLLEVLEEASRILPKHSWLSDLQLSETSDQRQQVIMSGLSADSPSLVGLIDSSPLFSDASMTAPISLDPIEGRERFTLQVKLKTRDVPKAGL